MYKDACRYILGDSGYFGTTKLIVSSTTCTFILFSPSGFFAVSSLGNSASPPAKHHYKRGRTNCASVHFINIHAPRRCNIKMMVDSEAISTSAWCALLVTLNKAPMLGNSSRVGSYFDFLDFVVFPFAPSHNYVEICFVLKWMQPLSIMRAF